MRHRRKRKSKTVPAAHPVVNMLKKMGLTDQARRLRIAGAWAQAVGPEIASRTEPQSFRRGVLIVKSQSAAWQNELTFLKQEIIEKVNIALGGKQTVRELKVISGTIRPKATIEAPPWVHASPTQDDLDVAHDAAQAIEDPQLRRDFERIVLLSRRRARAKTDSH